MLDQKLSASSLSEEEPRHSFPSSNCRFRFFRLGILWCEAAQHVLCSLSWPSASTIGGRVGLYLGSVQIQR